LKESIYGALSCLFATFLFWKQLPKANFKHTQGQFFEKNAAWYFYGQTYLPGFAAAALLALACFGMALTSFSLVIL
jgi:hypothetical protein